MTSFAMVAGMIPMATGLGDGAEQSAPLGRAVIGGLALATLATLTVLRAVYAMIQRQASALSPSLYLFDPASRWYEPSNSLPAREQGRAEPNPHAEGLPEEEVSRADFRPQPAHPGDALNMPVGDQNDGGLAPDASAGADSVSGDAQCDEPTDKK